MVSEPIRLSCLVGVLPHVYDPHSRSQSLGTLASYSVAGLLMSLPGAWTWELCKVQVLASGLRVLLWPSYKPLRNGAYNGNSDTT